MKNATTILSDADRQRVVDAVADAERQTSAEFVCALSTESGRYDRAESIVGLFGSLLALSVAYAVNHQLSGGSWNGGDWGDAAGTGLHVGWASAAVVVGFVVGSVLASYCHPIRRVFTSAREMDVESRRAAAHVFNDASLHMTSARTGLLIYVSLFERRVIILADAETNAALGEQRIAAMRDAAVESLRAGDYTGAMIGVIHTATETLREALPVDRETDTDELSNHVPTYHPRP
ncbi:MAG: hypothetical protein GC159_01640 [Phycisphaera sp.]|nr:hypothetical protein [Phycisphaera sp.]